jgi:hypothetical protein
VDGDDVLVAATDVEALPSQADPAAKPFTHQVVVVRGGKVERAADLTRQATSTGPFVSPAGILASADSIWVSAESSDEVAILERATLAEKKRVKVPGGPRHLVATADGVAVHSFRSFEVTFLGADGALKQTVRSTEDPRPANVALGERVFMRPGTGFAANHSCSGCHIEAQNDGMVWRFGAKHWANVRPLQLLAATTPGGWSAYTSGAENFGVQGPASIVNRPATTEEAEGLSAFLASLVGAPRATGKTDLDGSYTEAALRGKALFEGKATCASCHAAPLYTTRRVVPLGKSGEPADVPSLLGVYRHGVYFVKGQARSLEDAVEVATRFVQVDLTREEKSDLLRFLQELTPKGAAPLGIYPDLDSREAVPTIVEPWVEFGEPIAEADASQHLSLLQGEAIVPAEVRVEGRRLTLKPKAALEPGKTYTFRVKEGLAFRSGGRLEAPRVSTFTVARPAAGDLSGTMVLTVTAPAGGGPPRAIPIPVEVGGADGTGIRLALTRGPDAKQRIWARVEDKRVLLQSFALPLGRAAADANQVEGTVVTLTGTRITRVEGKLRMTAPGIEAKDVPWVLEVDQSAGR